MNPDRLKEVQLMVGLVFSVFLLIFTISVTIDKIETNNYDPNFYLGIIFIVIMTMVLAALLKHAKKYCYKDKESEISK